MSVLLLTAKIEPIGEDVQWPNVSESLEDGLNLKQEKNLN
jgi:hypothetical protein